MKVLMYLAVFCVLPACVIAVSVDPDSPDGIAAILGLEVLCTDGIVFTSPTAPFTVWEEHSLPGYLPLPVSVADMRDWDGYIILTTDGEIYLFEHGEWRLLPEVPCSGDVSTETETSFGDLKSLYR
jgi:hypothetical protein